MNEQSLAIAFTENEMDALMEAALGKNMTIAQYIHHAALAHCLSERAMNAFKGHDQTRLESAFRSLRSHSEANR